MSHFAARLSITIALCTILILPDISIAGPFRRRCRHRQRYTQASCCDTTTTQPAMVTSGCQSGAICVTRLSAKYLDSTGKCVYAVYDAVQCPSATTSHYDTNCAYVCPKYCTSSPCSCLNRQAVTTIQSKEYEQEDADMPGGTYYTAKNELLIKGLTAEVEKEEYPNAKKVDEFVIELEKDVRVKIIWLKLSEGRYAGAGHQVSTSTPISPQEIRRKITNIDVDGKPSKAFLVHVASINDVKVDQDYVVLVK